MSIIAHPATGRKRNGTENEQRKGVSSIADRAYKMLSYANRAGVVPVLYHIEAARLKTVYGRIKQSPDRSPKGDSQKCTKY